MSIKVEIRDMTPEWATEILEQHNKRLDEGKFRQRVINDSTVIMYAGDMKNGRWMLNGQGISFDEDGNLIDGQHRIAAVIRAGVTVPMLVMTGLPKSNGGIIKTIDTFDIGKRRLLANQLKIDGFEYYSEIAAGSRCLLMLAIGGLKRQFAPTQGIAIAKLMRNNLMEVMCVLKANNAPKYKWSGSILGPIALLGTADKDTAILFATEFNEMANLGKTSPVLQFEKFLQRPTYIKGGTDYQLHVVGGLSCALRAYSEGRKLDMIRSSNQDNIEWLLKTCKKAVAEIRKVAGIMTTVEELQNWEGKRE